ncbi:dioxygenase family protein [Flavobacterium caeni]|uniref:Por secretion system C-terminal sorting domain-containing protein n=1 Tax=Flavobacterium caeni TaxID=490189 RepID=A0A1G5G7Q8_9FLAO|nr:T9SS type A sorting domain-containing protein [Flavobacterium caeni]SCY47646.1 Por secretion system C-terminal sorting domain-containing protein [Flavobacterium caeni]
MERKVFLRNGLGILGMAVAAPSLLRAKQTDDTLVCTVTNSETAGPFPTHTPSSLVMTDIRGDRTGVTMNVTITIVNTNANCAPLADAIVDIWHCDKDGNYSEYGGTGMQQANYTNYHFLRGRQTTDANGQVSFVSIFPGWYTGRATHIHVHVYNPSGNSLLVTQIAYPEGANSAVQLVNTTAAGYTKGMNGYTYNANDNVFSDGVTSEMSVIPGSVAAGYDLTHTINVNGPTLGVEDRTASQYMVGQNYPNPFTHETAIPVKLMLESTVTIRLFDLNGRAVGHPIANHLPAGSFDIVLSKADLALSSGYYLYKVSIENADGVFEHNKKMIVA